LRGYIVQFSFADRAEAERWFSLLNQEGYVTSISLSGEGRPVRLRVGNFPSPVEAKNALGRFQKKGLTGLVVQLPN
jgi:cell division septation protein DedD